GLTKPRFGRRRCSGIWPPSKPLMATPERDFWPLWPWPLVLPSPDPAPRPRRLGFFVAPGLSRSSFSFIDASPLPDAPGVRPSRRPRMTCGRQKRPPESLPLLDDLDEVRNRVHHPADRGRVLELAGAVHLVQPQPDQGLALDGR